MVSLRCSVDVAECDSGHPVAWPVNFNYAVKTFEPSIAGAKHLVDLALKSSLPIPPRYIFISSISVSRSAFFISLHIMGQYLIDIYPDFGQGAQLPEEEQILDPSIVVGQGYPESKWIVERMLDIASARTPLQSLSIRLGQLAGGSSGCWNVSDWVPVIARSANKLGCLPDCETVRHQYQLNSHCACN